jgi:hypothetical protein
MSNTYKIIVMIKILTNSPLESQVNKGKTHNQDIHNKARDNSNCMCTRNIKGTFPKTEKMVLVIQMSIL